MTNTNTIDTAAANDLRSFALAHGEAAFAHTVTQALLGDERAIEQVTVALSAVSAAKLDAIRSTDTTRPDGAIARSFQI